MNVADIGFMYEEVWNARSALNKSVNDHLTMCRWDKDKIATFGNIICLTKREYTKHAKLDKTEWEAIYGSEFLQFVGQRFEAEARLQSTYRVL